MNNVERVNQEFIDSYSKLLSDGAPKKTGALAKSVVGKETDSGIDMYMLPYATYVDKGINGTERSVGSPYSFTTKKPPLSSIMSYAKSINMNPYQLQNIIFKQGIKPQPFIENDKTNKELEDYSTDLANAIWDDSTKDIE